MWQILAFGSAFFAGLTAILAKCGIKDVDSNLATAIRTVVVLIFSWLLVFLAGSQSEIGAIDLKTWIFLILSGLATGGSWLCYFRALRLGDVNKVTAVDKSSTVLTMLLAFIFLGEPLSLLKALAMVLIGVGTYLMIQKKPGEPPPQSGGRAWLLYAFGAALFAALTAILGKIGIEGVDSTLGTAIRTVVVLLMAWLMVFITGKQRTIGKIDGKAWLFLILSGLATGGSWLCYFRALRLGPAAVIVPIDKLSILVTILFSYLVFKETLSRRSGLGLVMIVVGTLSLLLPMA